MRKLSDLEFVERVAYVCGALEGLSVAQIHHILNSVRETVVTTTAFTAGTEQFREVMERSVASATPQQKMSRPAVYEDIYPDPEKETH